MNTVFQLEEFCINGKRYPIRKTTRWTLGYHSTLEKAKQDMASSVDIEEESKPVCDTLCYIITEWEIDSDCGLDIISIQTYLKDGSFYERNFVDRDKVYRGRPKDKIRFKHGDIVEVLENGYLRLAIVGGEPSSVERVNYLRERAIKNGHLKEGEDLFMDISDDQYMVYDLTGGGHSHIESQFVFPHFKHVSKHLRERLWTAMETEF
ncbi:hypothetical protein [Prevotella lacticifex]|nr:hypothetical protein [Prevotella lacticifex]GJG69357.1 hypothetical protein PRLR6025_28260 [Prevotella lacticifex]